MLSQAALSLLATLLLPVSIVASPVGVRMAGLPIALPFTKRINTNGAAAVDLVQLNQARVAAFKGRAAAIHASKFDSRDVLPSTGNVTSQAVSYIASIGVGTPPTYYNLIVDTGSSNTWVGADKSYTQTSSSVKTDLTMSVSYGIQNFSGVVWVDTITPGSGPVAPWQLIGVASNVNGFSPGIDGVLGLGPLDLTIGTLTNKPTGTAPTLTDVYNMNGIDQSESVSIFFAPPTSDNVVNGELTFGGTDSGKYNGNIMYTSVTSTSPASEFWGINLSITYGDKPILSQTAGIVDTGSALVLIPSDAYDVYKQVTGATEDEATRLLKLTSSQYDNLQNLNFNVYSQTYSLVPNAQIWPRTLNSYVGGSSGVIYSIVSSTGSPSGQGLDFSLGQVFVERFYSVFDTTNAQVGFATTNYTNATTN